MLLVNRSMNWRKNTDLLDLGSVRSWLLSVTWSP